MADEVTREMEMPAKPEAVWHWLTDPDLLGTWLGVEEVEVDAQPGGELRVREGSDTERIGWVEEVQESQRLVFWWQESGQDATRVQLELEELEHGTLLRVVETRPLATLELQVADLASDEGAFGGPVMLARVA
jgi:uncharacterized protein YndB with AHSA1/START domain